MLLSGKKAIIAGVSREDSIAWGIAKAFHREGAEIALLCLPSIRRRVMRLAEQIATSVVIDCDVCDDGQIAEAFRELGTSFGGRADILVHCLASARLEDLGGEFVSIDRAGWNYALEVSAYSLVALARASRPLLRSAGGGSIITVSFLGGDRIVPGYNIMGVAKAALECSVRYLAQDLGLERIRVNAISSGPIVTASSTVIENFEEARERAKAIAPIPEPVSQDDVGNLAAFLGSDLSRRITAMVMHVDAGCSAVGPGVRGDERKASRRTTNAD